MEDQDNIGDEQNNEGGKPAMPPIDVNHRFYDQSGRATAIIPPQAVSPEVQKAPEQSAVPAPATPDKKLYDELYKTQLYTKTYPEFQKQFNNPQSIDKLYQGLSESELYTKPKEDFYGQFFAHLPQKEVTDAHDFINNYLASPKANKAINKITEDQYYKNIYQQQQAGAQGRDATKLAQPLPLRLPDQAESDRKDFAAQMQNDPTLIRPVIAQAKRQNPADAPKINQAMYVSDASKRAHSPATMKYYGDQLASGKMDYDINKKQLVKPVGTFDAIFQGLKNHSDTINEYDFLTSHNDEDVIKHLDEKIKNYDPDKPVYRAQGALSSVGEMVGSNMSAMSKMSAGSAAARLAGSLAPELSIPIAAITTMGMGAGVQDFHHTSYANTLEETYRELREQHPDADPHVILNEAKKQANASGAFAMAQGLLAGEVGGKLAKESNFEPVRIKPGFVKALTDIGKTVGKNGIKLVKDVAPDITGQTLVAGGIKGIENLYRGKPVGEGLAENMGSNLLFMAGLASLHAPDLILGKEARVNLVDGYAKAPPEIVDNTLKKAVDLNVISPETAVKTKQEIEAHRTETEGMPDLTSPITPEAEHLLAHIEETGADPSRFNKKVLDKIAKDNGIEPEEGKTLSANDIVEKLQNKQKSAKLPKTFIDANDLVEQAAPKLTGIYKDMYEKDPEGFLKFIAEQAHGNEVNRTELEQANGITKSLVDAAIVKYPENTLSEPKAEKPHVTISTPAISNVKLKTKPIAEMNSDELLSHAKNLKALQSDLEVRMFGDEGAKKYREAQSVSNSDFSSPEKRKEADNVIKEMHNSLTPKQSEEFFSKQDDPAEIRDISRKVRSVEDSENMDELSSSVRAALSNMDKNNPSDEFLAIMNAAKKKTSEMGIDVSDLVKEVVKKVGDKYKDAEDAEFMMKSALDKLTNIKPIQNAIPERSATPVHVDEAPGNSGQMGEGVPKPEEPSGAQKITIENKNEGEGEKMRLAHKDTEDIYKELNLPDRIKREVKPDTKLEQDANDLISKGIDFDEVANETLANKRRLTDIEQVAFSKAVSALKAKQEGMDINDPDFNKYQNQIEKLSRASDVSGSESGAALRARQMYVPKDESLSDYVMREKEASGVGELTEGQKKVVQDEFNEISKTEAEYEKRLKAAAEENAKLKAELEVKNAKKSTSKRTKKSADDFKKERDNILSDLKKHWDESKGQLSSSFAFGAERLFKIAPDVAKLMKSYLEEGIDKLEDIVKGIHAQVKEYIPEITEKDIHNIIAGEYNSKIPTKNQLAERMFNLKQEAKLINQLDALNNGEVPKSEKKKIQRNKEIEDLKKQIKEHDLTKLSAVRSRIASEIEKVQKDIDEGRYAPEAKEQQIKLDEETQALKDKLIKLKQERELRLIRQQYANRNKYEKTIDVVLEIANVPRTLMSSVDFSAPLRQGLIPTISHPTIAAKAAVDMFKAAFSQKHFDEWFFDYKESKLANIADQSKLSVSDPHDYRLSAKEEAFMNNFAEKIPILGKLVKGSERAYVLYLNKMRVDLFKQGVDQLLSEGKTIDNAKSQYEGLASWVNNSTGRGELGKLQSAAPILNSVLFAPRLIASRINLLNPIYYYKLPKEIRVKAVGDMMKFVGFGMSVLALAKLNGMSVEIDPRSSDFGKIKVGDTRYDIWGGFQQYVRVFSQLIAGQTKSSNTGKIYDLTGPHKLFGKDRTDVLGTFLRGKLAPVPSMGWDLIKGRNFSGQPATIQQEAIDHFQPLLFNDIQDAWKTQGVQSLFTVGLPGAFGVGVQTYQNKPKSDSKRPSLPKTYQ